jgi:hypothetical protein
MAKRRKKATKKTGKVTVSRAVLDKVISLGAGHHAAIAQLKRTAKAAPRRKKAAKKRSRRR